MAEKTTTIVLNVDDKGAVKSVNNLNNALDDTANAAAAAENASDNLAESLERQEARIKTLGGAINIVGGAVEVAVGSFVAFGFASEETAKKAEELVLSTIAVADGAKRMQEGYKELNEGLKQFGGISGAVVKAFNAIKAAALANPFTALAIGITAVVSAFVIYNQTSKETEEQSEETKKAIESLTKAMMEQRAISGANANSIGVLSRAYQNGELTTERYVAQLKTLGINLDGVNVSTAENIKLVNDLATANNNINSQQAERTKLEGELKTAVDSGNRARQRVLMDEIAALDINMSRYTSLRDEIMANFDAQKKANEQHEKKTIPTNETLKEQTTEMSAYFNSLKDNVDVLIEALGGYEQLISGPLQQAQENFTNRMNQQIQMMRSSIIDTTQKELPTLFESYVDLIGEILKTAQKKQVDFFQSDLGKAAQSSLAVASQFASVLTDSIDDSTKEGFEKAKQYKIAEARIASIQAAFNAYGSVIGVPIVGAVLAPIAAAAALAVGQNAINDIKASTFNDKNAPSNPAQGGGVPSGGAGGMQPQFRGQFLPITAPTRPEPIQAYVLQGDISSGAEAQAQLQTRRRFG